MLGKVLSALIQDSDSAAKYFAGCYLGKFPTVVNAAADVMIQAFKNMGGQRADGRTVPISKEN